VHKILRVKKLGHLLPVLPLIPQKTTKMEEEKGKFIAFDLKTRIGQPSDATKYKKYVRKFEEVNPQKWIDMLRDLKEIWTRAAEDCQISPISVEHINLSLSAVTETVFPHQALETQRLWMNRKMFTPVELTTRHMAASINRLNNALPFFPTATKASKFSKIELIGLLEWSLPAT
jgi:hypothetical protein